MIDAALEQQGVGHKQGETENDTQNGTVGDDEHQGAQSEVGQGTDHGDEQQTEGEADGQ